MNVPCLYISYDGVLEPLGQSQVLRYLEGLAPEFPIVLVSFEKRADWRQVEKRKDVIDRLQKANIKWIPLRYHKQPSAIATTLDIAQGMIVGAWVVVRHRTRIVHARSYVPSVIALALKKIFRVKYIFDMRGFWADERVDGGLWPADGRLYRTAKWFERRFMQNSDCVVSLTNAAISEMRTFSYLKPNLPHFELITTCADLELFRPSECAEPSLFDERTFTLGYVGSVGVWYLFDEALRCFSLLRDLVPEARMHIVNRGDHHYILERMAILDVDPSRVKLESLDHVGVARAMQNMDAGIFFYKPTYSKMATAPTKLGEFLGCGIPCLSNSGVGDLDTFLEREHVGVALRHFEITAMREAIERLVQMARTDGVRQRCRAVALRYFSLEHGISRYHAIYSELAKELSSTSANY
jgi:glycosyltransferase involved in cell wall biosynthesis